MTLRSNKSGSSPIPCQSRKDFALNGLKQRSSITWCVGDLQRYSSCFEHFSSFEHLVRTIQRGSITMTRRSQLIQRCAELGLQTGKNDSNSSLENILRAAGVEVDRQNESVNVAATSPAATSPESSQSATLDEATLETIVSRVVSALTPQARKRKATEDLQEDDASDFSDSDEDDVPLATFGKKSIATVQAPNKNTLKAPFGLRYAVPDTVRRAVLRNKPVALYKLLTGFEAQSGNNIISKTDGEGRTRLSVARDSDKKLEKQLLHIGQLVQALQKYKSIVAEVSASRAENIDFYLSNILYIYNSYPGNSYWNYHTHFWEGAGEFARAGLKVDWRSLDPVSFQATIARSAGPNLCEKCSSHSHNTATCPFVKTVASTVKDEPSGSSQAHIKLEVPGKKKYCAFFNHHTCRRGASSCDRPHKCFLCDKEDHGWQDCKLTPYLNY